MKRREFIALLGGAALFASFPARAQQPGRTYRIGFLIPLGQDAPAVAAFFDELRHNGFIEGQNLTIIPGGFGVRNEQIAELAAVVVKTAPDVIVGGSELYSRALQALTQTIPVVSISEDLVGEGLVASLSRPGGNITGISILAPSSMASGRRS